LNEKAEPKLVAVCWTLDKILCCRDFEGLNGERLEHKPLFQPIMFARSHLFNPIVGAAVFCE